MRGSPVFADLGSGRLIRAQALTGGFVKPGHHLFQFVDEAFALTETSAQLTNHAYFESGDGKILTARRSNRRILSQFPKRMLRAGPSSGPDQPDMDIRFGGFPQLAKQPVETGRGGLSVAGSFKRH